MKEKEENSGNPREFSIHPVVGNSKHTEVIENPYYGMDDLRESGNSVTVKKTENPYYNEADWCISKTNDSQLKLSITKTMKFDLCYIILF